MSLQTLILQPASSYLLLPPEIKPAETSRICQRLSNSSSAEYPEALSMYFIILIVMDI